MKILLFLIFAVCLRADWSNTLLTRVITETEPKFTDRVDAITADTASFCWTSHFQRVYTSYFCGEMAGFTVWNVKQLNLVCFTKIEGKWRQDGVIQSEETECANYPWLSEKLNCLWMDTSEVYWLVDESEEIPKDNSFYIP